MTRKVMNRRFPKTLTMSTSTPPIDFCGAASTGRSGSWKKRNVETKRRNVVAEDMTSTHAMPTFSRTGMARIGPTAPPMFTRV
jgi:hypothetical protein